MSDGIFTPVAGDIGLGLARRTLGCIVDQIWQGQACSNAGLIGTIAGAFNLGIAAVAGLLVTYAIYRGIANTARTGQAGGETSTAYSVARLGLGAVLLLPVASGFTLAQILVVQVLVWGSGLADTVWSKAAASIQAGGYMTTSVEAGAIDPRLRGELAAALYVRTAGYLCADSLNGMQSMMQGAGAQITSSTVANAAGWFSSAQTHTWSFEGGPFFNKSASLCGSVSYTLAPDSAPVAADDLGAYEALSQLANQAVAGSMQAAMQSVDANARALASAIEAGHDVADAKERISAGVRAAATTLQTGMQAAFASGNISDLAAKYLEKSTDAGWVMAPTWQRAMTNLTNKIETLKRSVTLEISAPEPIDSYVYGAARSGALRTILDRNLSDMNMLQSLAGYVADFSSINPTGAAGSTPRTDNSAGLVAGSMRAMLSTFSIDSDSTRFVDPFGSLQATGAALSYGAAGAQVAGLALDWLPATRVASAVTGAGGWLSSLGGALALAGFVLAGLLPLVPLAYFLSAVVAWLIAALEALVAAGLWVLGLFALPRGSSIFSGAEQGLLLGLGLLLRPALIVTGLVASLLLASAGVVLLNTFAESVFAIMIPLDGGPATSGMLGAGAIAFYVVAALTIIIHTSSIITELPDAVLRWVGVAGDQHSARLGAVLAGAVAAPATLNRAAARALSGGPRLRPPSSSSGRGGK